MRRNTGQYRFGPYASVADEFKAFDDVLGLGIPWRLPSREGLGRERKRQTVKTLKVQKNFPTGGDRETHRRTTEQNVPIGRAERHQVYTHRARRWARAQNSSHPSAFQPKRASGKPLTFMRTL